MTDIRTRDNANRFVVVPTAEAHFSWLRTRMSTERTLMSWVRTATALIGFGFTIFQFFERFNRMEGIAPPAHPRAPQYVGLALIGSGIIALIIAAWQYHWLIRYLWNNEFKPIAGVEDTVRHTPVLGIVIVLILIGFLAFVAVLLRLP